MLDSEKYRDSAKPTSGMLFVVTSDNQRADAATRKAIRSHAMRGRKQNSSKRRDKALAKNGEAMQPIKADQIQFEDLLELYTPLVLSDVGSDLCFVPFAQEIELSMLLNITKISPISIRIMFPLMTLASSKTDHAEWLYTIRNDIAALHITAYSVTGFIDRILRRKDDSSAASLTHYEKGITLLRERLADGDNDQMSTDSTIGTVIKLAVAALFGGEHKTAQEHMDGVRKMVNMRGGLAAFDGKYLQIEIIRCDLSVAIFSGSEPAFSNQRSQPFVEYPLDQLPKFDDIQICESTHGFLTTMDNDLRETWVVMTRFCALVNLGAQAQRRVPLTLISSMMASVMYRLLAMRYVADSTHEAVRNGLLVLTYHIFLQWQDIKLAPQHLCDSFRGAIECLKRASDVSPDLLLWMSMVGAVSIYDLPTEPWLKEDLRRYANLCRVGSWNKMQDVLKSFMWINLLDGRSGQSIFNSLFPDNDPGLP